jgi:hypothetical protein
MTDHDVWEESRNKYREKLRALIDGKAVTGIKPMSPEEARKTLAAFESHRRGHQ